MSIQILVICEWKGVQRGEVLIVNPTWDQVDTAIRTLDDGQYNDVYLQPLARDGETFLRVAGGKGRYLVSAAVGGQTFPTLVDPGRDPVATETLFAGGLSGAYPSRWITPLETALNVAHSYFETGRISEEHEWEEV